MDMAGDADFDLAAARQNIQSVRPGMQILEDSSKTGAGMQRVMELLRDRHNRSREIDTEAVV
jgi:hydrogenase nickel incorporation protein HypB